MGKRVVVTGGTGSLGNALVKLLLSGELGLPERITVFSRDEAKQHAMRIELTARHGATDDIIYDPSHRVLGFRIGDVADYPSICAVLRDADAVFHAAPLKQVPTCEYFPDQAVRTNVNGPSNVVRAIREHRLPVQGVVAVSTDKACRPVNVMDMTKAVQERITVQANLDCGDTRFVLARYGNVLASRGSVVPLFREQIRQGGPVTVTLPEMTRFLKSMDWAVDTVFEAARHARPGEIYIPRLESARVVDLAGALIGDRAIDMRFTGIRPGEKLHEVMISDDQAYRTVDRGEYLAIQPLLPELRKGPPDLPCVDREYSSADRLMTDRTLQALLREQRLLQEDRPPASADQPR
ncbi:MAG: polysaccharide biosynthesis protein [Chloroflexota bacterium]